jgi:ATP-binding cassette subfamily F protein uup
VLGYLEDFLFTPSQSRGLASRLSGGERNRLLLAKLFTKPSNVLVLDEPTNDLDVETLDLIEEILVDYPGTVLMVSHDRVFLNNVVTSTLVFEGEDAVKEYVGGYDDWVRQRKTVEMAKAKVEKKKPAKEKKTSKPKLTWKQQKELKGLPERIEKLESDIAGIHDAMGDADFYKQAAEVIASQAENLKQLENELSVCYDRWEKLEELA